MQSDAKAAGQRIAKDSREKRGRDERGMEIKTKVKQEAMAQLKRKGIRITQRLAIYHYFLADRNHPTIADIQQPPEGSLSCRQYSDDIQHHPLF